MGRLEFPISGSSMDGTVQYWSDYGPGYNDDSTTFYNSAHVYDDGMGYFEYDRIYMFFDCLGLPSNITITAMYLKAYVNYSDSVTSYFYAQQYDKGYWGGDPGSLYGAIDGYGWLTWYGDVSAVGGGWQYFTLDSMSHYELSIHPAWFGLGVTMDASYAFTSTSMQLLSYDYTAYRPTLIVDYTRNSWTPRRNWVWVT